MELPRALLRPARLAVVEIADWIPHGRTLPDASWRVRHRAVVILLLAHAIGITVWGVVAGLPPASIVLDASVPALGAYAASRQTLPRMLRSAVAAGSAMLTSAVIVHLMHGSIEAHFHFFAMIPIIALYEEWLPFGLAVVVVLIHHGVAAPFEGTSVAAERPPTATSAGRSGS